MRKIINKISAVVQVVLLAPIKLPAKLLHIIRYIGFGLGILETVLDEKKQLDEEVESEEETTEQQ